MRLRDFSVGALKDELQTYLDPVALKENDVQRHVINRMALDRNRVARNAVRRPTPTSCDSQLPTHCVRTIQPSRGTGPRGKIRSARDIRLRSSFAPSTRPIVHFVGFVSERSGDGDAGSRTSEHAGESRSTRDVA